jgi:hypothetical protein
MSQAQFNLRRVQAAKYVTETHNYPCSPRTLAKLACTRSDGPPFLYAGRFPLYSPAGLDSWVISKRGPVVRNTAEARGAGQFHSEKK